MRDIHFFQVCGDCLHTCASGAPDYPEYGDTGHAARYAGAVREWGGEPWPHSDPETGEYLSGFSWSPCEFCGDHLGGDRFDAAIEVRDTATTGGNR